jgi:hypothetical protein
LVNGANVTPSLAINKVGDTTTIRYNQDPIFPFGSTVTYEFDGTDNLGQLFEFDGQFVADQPYFPYQKELAGAEEMAVDGNWGVRYIFNVGELNDLETVLTAIGDAADDPVNFAGTIVDTSEPEMNHSDDGSRFTIQPDLPYHPDAIAAGLPADDFIMYGVACMRIEEAGTYTIGVHSDDGFGLRVHGWTFTEAFGGDIRDARNGTIDPSSPDTVIHPSVTGDSNVRAIAENVQPGLYRIEFTWYERGGGDHGEIYIAKGRYPNDADTSEWLPIGRTESRRGVALVSKAQSLRITDFIYDQSNDKLTISWSAREGKTYGLFLSPDLSDWGGDINDSISAIDSNPDPLAKFDPESGIMTYGPLPNPEAGASRLYFRVVENQN